MQPSTGFPPMGPPAAPGRAPGAPRMQVRKNAALVTMPGVISWSEEPTGQLDLQTSVA